MAYVTIVIGEIKITVDTDPEKLSDIPYNHGATEEKIVHGMMGNRTVNCLKSEGVDTVGKLLNKSEADLLNIQNMGKRGVEEIKSFLAERGLKLKEE